MIILPAMLRCLVSTPLQLDKKKQNSFNRTFPLSRENNVWNQNFDKGQFKANEMWESHWPNEEQI